MTGDTTLASAADSPAGYTRFGLDPTSIAQWEDGARTDNRSGTYEWWDFDAHLDDGAKLVVVHVLRARAGARSDLILVGLAPRRWSVPEYAHDRADEGRRRQLGDR